MIWLVRKTVDSSVLVEASSEEEALSKAAGLEDSKWNDPDTSYDAELEP